MLCMVYAANNCITAAHKPVLIISLSEKSRKCTYATVFYSRLCSTHRPICTIYKMARNLFNLQHRQANLPIADGLASSSTRLKKGCCAQWVERLLSDRVSINQHFSPNKDKRLVSWQLVYVISIFQRIV